MVSQFSVMTMNNDMSNAGLSPVQSSFDAQLKYKTHSYDTQSRRTTNDVTSRIYQRRKAWSIKAVQSELSSHLPTQAKAHRDPFKTARSQSKGVRPQQPKIKTVPTPFVCLLCSHRFLNEGQLRTHRRRVHNNKKPIECGQCGKRSKTKSGLKHHVESKHKADPDGSAEMVICVVYSCRFPHAEEPTSHYMSNGAS